MFRRLAVAGLVGFSTLVVAAGVGLAALPSEIHVERSYDVRAPAHRVSSAIARFPDRMAWIPWTEQDPEAVYTFAGQPGTPGSTMSWEGEVIGTATMQLVSVSDHAIVTHMAYQAPMVMETTDRFELVALDAHTTRVTWINEGVAPAGPGRIFALLADSLLGPDYEEGLRRLDQHLSTNVAAN
jgi:hypothetical protein